MQITRPWEASLFTEGLGTFIRQGPHYNQLRSLVPPKPYGSLEATLLQSVLEITVFSIYGRI